MRKKSRTRWTPESFNPGQPLGDAIEGYASVG
jgi:hypothetical protein